MLSEMRKEVLGEAEAVAGLAMPALLRENDGVGFVPVQEERATGRICGLGIQGQRPATVLTLRGLGTGTADTERAVRLDTQTADRASLQVIRVDGRLSDPRNACLVNMV